MCISSLQTDACCVVRVLHAETLGHSPCVCSFSTPPRVLAGQGPRASPFPLTSSAVQAHSRSRHWIIEVVNDQMDGVESAFLNRPRASAEEPENPLGPWALSLSAADGHNRTGSE